MQEDKRFLELLRGWLSGDFARGDEQELRALTRADDFRREAAEGFMAQPEGDHEARLAALRQRLRERTGLGEPALTATRGNWAPRLMAAAAVLALLLAALWFIPSLQDKEAASPGPIARTEPAPAGNAAPSNEGATLRDAGPTVYKSPTVQPQSGSRWTEQKFEDKKTDSDAQLADEAPASSGAPGSFSLSKTQEPEAVSTETEKMAEVATAPVAVSPPPPAGPQDARKENVPLDLRQADRAGKAKAAPAKPSAKQYHTDTMPDMGQVRRAIREQSSLPAQSAPAEGWEEYLRDNARLTPAAKNHNISGSVRLQFHLDPNNEPQQILVIRSLGYGCDQAAMELVRGWTWLRGVDTTIVVDIPFVR